MDLAWWSNVEGAPQDSFSKKRFRFGHRIAEIVTDDPGFGERFLAFFHDCLIPAAHASCDVVRLRVKGLQRDDAVLAEISHHDDAIDPSVIETLFETELASGSAPGFPEWSVFAYAREPSKPVLAISLRNGRIVVSKAIPWQMLIAHYFLYHVMRLQQDMLFLHGASLAIGNQGVFLGGSKGAGKSTLSLALAARGHGFLGDEVTAIVTGTRALVPFRRAVSIREGPQARLVRDHLDRVRPERERLPDGTVRIRMSMSHIFEEAAPREVSLTYAFLLSGFARSPRVSPFSVTRKELGLLGMLPATVAARGASSLLGLINVFSRVRCYKVIVGGTPDEMAELLESIVEGRWVTPFNKERSASVHSVG